MISFVTSKKLAVMALLLSLTAITNAQTNATNSELPGINTYGSGMGPESSLPTTTGSGGGVSSGTTFEAPTASPSPTPGFNFGTTSGSSTTGNVPALNTTDGIPAGTGAIGSGPSAPSGNISDPTSESTAPASGSTAPTTDSTDSDTESGM